MTLNDRPPQLVRWTLRLEEAEALDQPVEALHPYVQSLFGSGVRGLCCAGTGWGTQCTPSSPMSSSAPGRPRRCSTSWEVLMRARPPRRWSAPVSWLSDPPPGPDGPSGQRPACARSGWDWSTQSRTPRRSAPMPPHGSPVVGATTPQEPGSRLPALPSQASVPTWAGTSSRHVEWPVGTPRTTTTHRAPRCRCRDHPRACGVRPWPCRSPRQ